MKRTPLPSHDWSEPLPNGDRECQTDGCSTVWVSVYDDPPPWPCVRQSSLKSSRLSPVSDTNSGRPNRDEDLLEYARQQPCVACGSPPPSDPHHVKSRGSGHGDRLEGGTCNVVSLCRSCHDALDSVGGGKQTFQRKHDISLAEKAERIGREYRREST